LCTSTIQQQHFIAQSTHSKDVLIAKRKTDSMRLESVRCVWYSAAGMKEMDTWVVKYECVLCAAVPRKEGVVANTGRITKHNGGTPSSQDDCDMLRSKRRGNVPILDQIDERAQRSKNQNEEENQLKGDHAPDGWMKPWWSTNGRARSRPIELSDWLQRLWGIHTHHFACIGKIFFVRHGATLFGFVHFWQSLERTIRVRDARQRANVIGAFSCQRRRTQMAMRGTRGRGQVLQTSRQDSTILFEPRAHIFGRKLEART